MSVYLNGNIVGESQAAISPLDRGFLFGDGVYEVVRATGGALVDAGRHWRRLARSLAGVRIARPAALDEAALSDLGSRLVRDNHLVEGDALVYLEITRGSVPRAHQFPPAGTAPTVFANAVPFTPPDALRARGAAVITLPDLRWGRCDLKTVNLLPNILAKQEAVQAGADEAILVRDGVVTEASTANVFAAVNGELRTHPLSERILPGVSREVVLEAARALGIRICEQPLSPDELLAADEVMLTSTTNDVMPVTRIDGNVVGGGVPGEVARRLFAAVMQRRARSGQ